jgi:diguanylate cyclase (GGDEF)-like protein/PAS domain S-box-containing protein
MRLSTFILENVDAILYEWHAFAATLVPAAQKTNQAMLLDHAKKMLQAIAADLVCPESAYEQSEKSKGHGLPPTKKSAATLHGADRMESGFSLDATLSEYRALRASVTRLWNDAHENYPMSKEVGGDMIRFNEAIDQALGESVSSYYFEKEQQTRVFDAILSSTPDLSFTFGLDGRFSYANKAFIELLGLSLNEIIGKNYVDLALPDTANKQRQILKVIRSKEHVRGEVLYTPPSGREDLYEYIFVPVFDKDGEVEAVAGTSRNITERKAMENKNWEKANYDLLTGLPNRCLFRDRLEQDVMHAARIGTPMALLFIDLDKFKEANDEFGHEAGDLLLRHAAERMRSCVRESDTVARLGGDEFTIILQDLGGTVHAENVARKILKEMVRPFHISKKTIRISASIGIALAPEDATTPEQLIKNADQAMYVSKDAGNNRFSFFSPDINQ